MPTLHHSTTSLPHHPTTPPPPWHLTGSAALLLSVQGVVMLVHYDTSPVGPYDEWALGVLTLTGPRIVDMAVNSLASMQAGRVNWGFPKRLALLSWKAAPIRVKFYKAGAIYRLRGFGPPFNLHTKLFCVQTLNSREIRVPLALRGRVRWAWRGRQIALLIECFSFEVGAPH